MRFSLAFELPEENFAWQTWSSLGVIAVLSLAAAWFYFRARQPAGIAWLGYLTLVWVEAVHWENRGIPATSDQISYLPALVISLLIGGGIERWSAIRRSERFVQRHFVQIIAVVVPCFVLIPLSWDQLAHWRDAESLWRYSFAINPESALARRKLADYLAAQGNDVEALQVYETAVKRIPFSAAAHADFGRALATRRDWPEAENSFRRALELDPDHLPALLGMGNIFAAKGNFAAAQESYRTALRIRPSASLHVNLGYSLMKNGRPEEAIKHYQAALRLDPGNVNAHFNLGSLLMSQGQTAAGGESFRRVIALRPNHSRAHFALAGLAAEAGHFKEAMDHYQEAINADPEFAEAYVRVGMLLATRNRFDMAIDYYRHALGLQGDLADARLGLARAFAAQGKKEEALREYQEARRLLQAAAGAPR
jgi:tetratricopeptide (TPR) repeat protein